MYLTFIEIQVNVHDWRISSRMTLSQHKIYITPGSHQTCSSGFSSILHVFCFAMTSYYTNPAATRAAHTTDSSTCASLMCCINSPWLKVRFGSTAACIFLANNHLGQYIFCWFSAWWPSLPVLTTPDSKITYNLCKFIALIFVDFLTSSLWNQP